MSHLSVIGTSHKQSPVELRERIAFAQDEIPEILDQLRHQFGLEAALLSTCNRTEIYLVHEGVESDEVGRQVRHWLAENRSVELAEEYLFFQTSHSAARHIMEVASGIDSQVIGDIQIIGQVRDAYILARDHGSLGPILTRLFETALRAGKRVKTETELFSGAVSVSYVAVELARKIFYPLENQKTLVVGAGDTGELTAVSLKGRGVTKIDVTNRTPERGKEMIARLGYGEWVEWESFREQLHHYDIVIVATGARDYVLDYDTVSRAAAGRGGDQMLIVDLAMPRNVDPRVSEIPNVFCKDLNDLNSVIETNVERRREEIPRAEEIISQELDEFIAWHRLAPVRPVLADLRGRAMEIAREMLDENRGRFSEKDFGNVEKLVESVARKIIALPMSHLLEAGNDPETALERAEYVRRLFGLGGEKND